MQTSSIEAILSLGSIADIPLDASRCAWQQPVDSRGRPRGKVRWGRWQLVTSRLTLAQYEELQALAASSTAVVDAHVTFLRADGQGTLSTLWGRNCSVCTTVERFDSRGQDGEPSWWLYIELAPEEMGKQAGGTPGPFVMPPPRSYAYAPPAAPAPTDAWLDDLKKLAGIEVRDNVKLWVANGLDENKLKSAIRSSVDKRLVYERLVKAATEKGIYQQRVVIDDYDNIPGVSKQPYNRGNSLSKKKLLANDFLSDAEKAAFAKTNKFGKDNEELDLPDYRTITFTGEAKLIKLKPGTPLYRVTDPGGEGGPWWTLEPPKDLAEVIGGTAVKPEWNGFSKVVQATVPDDGEPFYVWFGPAASQEVSQSYEEKYNNGYSLAGGTEQVFLPNPIKNNLAFKASFQDNSTALKSW